MTYMGLAPSLFAAWKQESAADMLVLESRGGNANDYLVWRNSAATELGYIESTGDVHLNDDIELAFGTLAAGDVVMRFDGTVLEIIPSTANTRFDLGDPTNGLDVRLVGSLAGGGARVDWDASAARLTLRRSTNANFAKLNFDTAITTVPTTGLAKGDLFLVSPAGDTWRLALCISTATQAVRYHKYGYFTFTTLGIIT